MKNKIKEIVKKYLNESAGGTAAGDVVQNAAKRVVQTMEKEFPKLMSYFGKSTNKGNTVEFLNRVTSHFGDDVVVNLEKLVTRKNNVFSKGNQTYLLTKTINPATGEPFEISVTALKNYIDEMVRKNKNPSDIIAKFGDVTFRDGTTIKQVFTPSTIKRAGHTLVKALWVSQGPKFLGRWMWEKFPGTAKTMTETELKILRRWFLTGIGNWNELTEIANSYRKDKSLMLAINFGGQLLGKYIFWYIVFLACEAFDSPLKKQFSTPEEANKNALELALTRVPFGFIVPLATIIEFVAKHLVPGGYITDLKNEAINQMKGANDGMENNFNKKKTLLPPPIKKNTVTPPKTNTTGSDNAVKDADWSN